MMNFVGIVERDANKIESWSRLGPKEDVLADFSGWHPTVRKLILEEQDEKLPDAIRIGDTTRGKEAI